MSVRAGNFTYQEIMSQQSMWSEAVHVFQKNAEQLKAIYTEAAFDSVLLTGCGSTYYLALTGAAMIQQFMGVTAQAYPASEIALLPERVFVPGRRYLLIAISRSGETTETLAAVRSFREHTQQPVIAVTCASESALGTSADLTFAVDAAQETSVAQTRSFASMLIVVQGIVASLANADQLDALSLLESQIADVFKNYHALARQLGEDRQIERFYFLGSGILYGIANEAMLKMKEMSLSYSEAFHFLEFRHGPMSMVNGQTLIIGLLSDDAWQQELSVLHDMRQRGATILAISEDKLAGDAPTFHGVSLKSSLPSWARTVLYLPLLQLMAYYRALSRDQNPDIPANLEFVISLNDSMISQ